MASCMFAKLRPVCANGLLQTLFQVSLLCGAISYTEQAIYEEGHLILRLNV